MRKLIFFAILLVFGFSSCDKGPSIGNITTNVFSASVGDEVTVKGEYKHQSGIVFGSINNEYSNSDPGKSLTDSFSFTVESTVGGEMVTSDDQIELALAINDKNGFYTTNHGVVIINSSVFVS